MKNMNDSKTIMRSQMVISQSEKEQLGTRTSVVQVKVKEGEGK